MRFHQRLARCAVVLALLHPFSIASAPASGERLQFVIKELGDFTRTLGGIEPGTRAPVDGPHGNMVVDGIDAPAIMACATRR